MVEVGVTTKQSFLLRVRGGMKEEEGTGMEGTGMDDSGGMLMTGPGLVA